LKAVAEVALEPTVQVEMVAPELLLTSLEHLPNTAAAAHLWVTMQAMPNMELHLVEEEFLKPLIQIREVMARQTVAVVAVAIMEQAAAALVVLVL
jgi:hypothetical protein